MDVRQSLRISSTSFATVWTLELCSLGWFDNTMHCLAVWPEDDISTLHISA